MRIAVDKNILVRAMTDDDEVQGRIARDILDKSESIALTLPALCETVWVLSRGYKISRERLAAGIRDLIEAPNVVLDYSAVEAGLEMLEAGGDFADGIFAHQGARMGAEEFVSFDRRAVDLLNRRGVRARNPA